MKIMHVEKYHAKIGTTLIYENNKKIRMKIKFNVQICNLKFLIILLSFGSSGLYSSYCQLPFMLLSHVRCIENMSCGQLANVI